MKILLAVDGSTFTKKMLGFLSTHPDMFNPHNDYVAFTAPPQLPPRARAAVGKDVVHTYQAEEAEKILAPVCKFLLRHGIQARSEWKVGNAGETISKVAENGKFDLIVMGSHGHGLLGNLVMGSVATRVLAHCSIPVLLVR